jgi:thiol-disulfide isomerase/thioredoxin
MRYLIFLFSIFIASTSAAQTVQSMSFELMEKKLPEYKGYPMVINFWATWCKPCVEELPDLEKLNEKYSSQKVKVILVNLDFNSKLKTVVEPFVVKKNLKSEIWHLTDTDPNTWINRIDSSWSGAIPTTVIYDSSHQIVKLHEGPISFSELEQIIQPYIRR